ncbi:DUF2326 domain-containing protein [Haemophilus influenzae]|uniref:DUF2326 domain-containing protein n=1 Tax=Haemophilus influenzae TaxID=727 RepID=UPI000DD435C4|nr:DUF2326 domain-containing protein [Haemophilus influenzae]
MRLMKLYSNKENIFKTLMFNNGVNAIVGTVMSKQKYLDDGKKHSHNLGKSTLAQIIDFCLICEHQKHVLLSVDKLNDFEFYLEIYLNDSKTEEIPQYLTICRTVRNPSKISFKKHTSPNQDFQGLMPDEWSAYQLSFREARSYLEGLLGFKFLRGYSYRKFFAYLLRTQSDFTDVFKLSRNSRSKDKDWKPFLSRLLGFDDELLSRLYNKEDEIKALNEEIKLRKKINRIDHKGFSEIEAQIAFIKTQISNAEIALSKLDFGSEDKESIRKLVDNIDDNIVSLNAQLYQLEGRKQRLESSLKPTKILFDTTEADSLFKEAGVFFSNQLKKDFDQLIRFNQAINQERNEYLSNDLEKTNSRIESIQSRLMELNQERCEKLSFLNEKEIFEKYKQTSAFLDKNRAELILLEQQKSVIEDLSNANTILTEEKQKRGDLVQSIEQDLTYKVRNDSNSQFIKIRDYFVSIIMKVVGEQAIIKVEQNTKGYIDFDAYFENQGIKNHKDKGTSFKKLLCIAFDMAIARYYAEQGYHSFIYHDGILESLDNNPKRNLLNVIREYSKFGIQHFITLLSDEVVTLLDEGVKPDEIILALNDAEDNTGRLFQMNTW